MPKPSLISNLRNAGLALSCAVCLAFVLAGQAQAESPLTIYFHNPEVSTVRNEVLKTVMDRYLVEKGDFSFQPVAMADTFESLLTTQESALFILPSWYFEQLRERDPSLKARLLGMKQRRSSYHKVLVSAETQLPETHPIVAIAGTEEHGQRLLQSMLGKTSAQGVQLLIVPKDIDALMSLQFGLADAALTRESSLRTYAALNQDTHKVFKELGRSPPIQGLLVAARLDENPQLRAALGALQGMPDSEDGRFGLNMLGLDDWEQQGTQIHQGGHAEQ